MWALSEIYIYLIPCNFLSDTRAIRPAGGDMLRLLYIRGFYVIEKYDINAGLEFSEDHIWGKF